MAEYIEPLNLEYILRNLLAGSTEVFMVISIMIISILCGKFNMPLPIYIIFISLSSMLLYGFYGEGLFVFFLIILGLISFFTINKLVKY